MGYAIHAYCDVDQEELERFLTDNNIDREDWDQKERISQYYIEKYITNETKTQSPMYIWNPKCGIHEICGTTFLRHQFH